MNEGGSHVGGDGNTSWIIFIQSVGFDRVGLKDECGVRSLIAA